MVEDLFQVGGDLLAVHSVGKAAMSRNAVAEVLQVEGSLESRRKESSERGNKRSKGGHDEGMYLEGSPAYWWDSNHVRQQSLNRWG